MANFEITKYITEGNEYRQISSAFDAQKRAKKRLPMLVTGMCDGARAAFIAETVKREREAGAPPVAICAPDEKTANRLRNSLEGAGLTTPIYPWRDMIFHNITASHEFEHERLWVLCALRKNECDAVIFTADAALQYTMPPERLDRSVRTLKMGGEADTNELTAFLVEAGYQNADLIDGVGQFSLRGGILDVFPPSSQYPIRIDFFGSDIDSISSFDILTQRRFEELDECEFTPAREIALSPDERNALKEHLSSAVKKAKTIQTHDIIAAELEAVKESADIKFADKYISLIYKEHTTLLDYLSGDCTCIMIDRNAVNERLASYEWHAAQNAEELCSDGLDGKLAEYGKLKADFEHFFYSHPCQIIDPFVTGTGDMTYSGLFTIQSRQTPSYTDNTELLFEDLISHLRGNYRVIILCENDMSGKQISEFLDERGITALFEGEPRIGHPRIVCGENIIPFELPVQKFAILSLYASAGGGARHSILRGRRKKKKKDAGEAIMSYADLTEGDYVVHESHGIGQYLGLSSLVLEGARRDFVKIKYAGKDMLYLPCDQLDSISKYIGARAEDGTMKLSKMGGAEWVKTKAKAKKAATDMAKELIALYAARLRREGFAFPADDEFQRNFEAGFEYEETDGQLQAVEDIKSDMEKKTPMDRLLCGDVGFGKTEVALRAAFKAVCAQKQVAVLVPTTILAMQHYQTFVSRMRGFPVHIDMISRFRTPKEQQQSIRKLRRGETDIIVGTHRIVSKDIEFKDLGLVIVDEEQRFGVAQKEKLKQMSTDVDVLTLTATPIPRTLNMAMSGIRDMSVLEEAPNERLPVQTYVLEYDDVIIGEAIRQELRRGGQVFYLYNRVEDINRVAERVAKMAPDARIAVAHGQMDRNAISDIWQSMITGDIDILVSTTIIETGIDIPNANTLIIENSDKMGLSQLHQIRGRIGRSSRRAYAYFTYPKGRVLTEVSSKRLSAIRDYTEFGSGFKIALRDLEIRGAGNLLGSEQHGHIESVGYDLYMKILNQAILEEKGEKFIPKPECTVDFAENAYLPEGFITSEVQRIEIYKKIASINNEEDLRDVTDELLDRWGDLPKPVANLLDISLLRAIGSDSGMEKINRKGTNVLFYPAKFNALPWTKIAGEYKGRILISPSQHPYVTFRTSGLPNALRAAQGLLIKYIALSKEAADSKTQQ